MIIEEGKFYRTRDGRKVGPVRWSKRGEQFATADGFDDDEWYTQHNYNYRACGYIKSSIVGPKPEDIIAEWDDQSDDAPTAATLMPGDVK